MSASESQGPDNVLRFPGERIPPTDTSVEDFYRGIPEKKGGADAMASIDDPLAAHFADINARRAAGERPGLRVVPSLGKNAVRFSGPRRPQN